MHSWQLQEAKNKLSRVVKDARLGEPQYITVHGQAAVVLLSVDEYQKLIQPKSKLSEALSMPELDDDELIFSRSKEVGRSIDL